MYDHHDQDFTPNLPAYAPLKTNPTFSTEKTPLSPMGSSRKLQGKKHYLADAASCASSRMNTVKYSDFMVTQGSSLTDSIQDADIILIDTCATVEEREDISLNQIKKCELNSKRDAKIIVCGCMAAINPEKLVQHYKGEFFSPKNEAHLATILGIDDEEEFFSPLNPRGGFMNLGFDSGNRIANMAVKVAKGLHAMDRKIPLRKLPFLDSFLASSASLDKNAYAVVISTGCMGNCSFCAIPLSKGETKSLPMGLIYEKIKSLVAEGVRRIYLTSEDTGAYGQDIGTNIAELLNKIVSIPQDFDLSINFFDPRWLRRYSAELLKVFASSKIRYIDLPLQSANNEVLKRMRRVYQIEHVASLMAEIKKVNPKINIVTDLIVGFPGETEEEFETTRKFVREYKKPFVRIQIHPFNSRKNAATEKMDNHLPGHVIDGRYAILKKEVGFFKSGLSSLLKKSSGTTQVLRPASSLL